MELKGRTALITGSAKGLGKMTALMLARMGCDIIINYVASEQEAEQLAADIRQSGVRATAIRADIASREEVARLAAEAQTWSNNGSIDILINNAGPFIRERRRFAEYGEADIITLLHGNLLGVMLLDHHLLPRMRENQWAELFILVSGMPVKAGVGRSVPSMLRPRRD